MMHDTNWQGINNVMEINKEPQGHLQIWILFPSPASFERHHGLTFEK